jgi:hypothetical protein
MLLNATALTTSGDCLRVETNAMDVMTDSF